MNYYFLGRCVLIVPTLLGISFLAFGVAALTPGDPAEEILRRTTDRPPSEAEVAQLRRELGLDRPIPVQYVVWAGRAARGNLGISFATRRPVIGEILHRIPASLQLAIPAAFLALAISIPVGIISAIHRNRLVDQMVRICSLAGASIPSFWLALLLIIFLAVKLSLVPVAGRVGASSVLLPALTLAVTPAAVLARFTRSAMLEILGEDYIRSARAKGLPERLVVGRHALRNALLPVITAFGTSLGHLISGAVVIESIFAWPGFGKLALDSILQRDYPMIQGYVLFTGVIFVALNLIIDLSYTRIDPRIRFSGGFIRDAAR